MTGRQINIGEGHDEEEEEKPSNGLMAHIRRYPFSILSTFVVLFLSFFDFSLISPPSDMPPMLNDKMAHFLMYLVVAIVLWVEYIHSHKYNRKNLIKGLILCILCPIILGGLVEIGQGELTTFRTGDVKDFIADVFGVLVALIIAAIATLPSLLRNRQEYED